MTSHHLTFKILVIGDEDVGKTTLINHYTLTPACFNSGSTVGIDFQSRMVALSADAADDSATAAAVVKSVKNYEHVKFCFWDTSGSPQYQSLAQTYYKHISAVIVVFDLSNEKTYASLYSYIHRAIKKNVCIHHHKHPILVIGNKLDKRTIQKTYTQIHDDLSFEFPTETIKYTEVSCLDKVYVDDAIRENRYDNSNKIAGKTAAASGKIAAAAGTSQPVVYNCATCAKSSDVHYAITSFLQFAYDSTIKPHYYNPNAISDIGCAGINGTSRYFKLKKDKDNDSSYSSVKTPRKCCGEHYYSTHLYPYLPSSPSSPSPSSPCKEKDYSGCGCTIL